jgi:hypothetical protein
LWKIVVKEKSGSCVYCQRVGGMGISSKLVLAGSSFFPFEVVHVRQVKPFSSTHNLHTMEEENEKV